MNLSANYLIVILNKNSIFFFQINNMSHQKGYFKSLARELHFQLALDKYFSN